MKRLIVYYSLSGNTEEAVKTAAELLGCDVMKLETVKPMPRSFAAQILVGGGQVAMGIRPALRPYALDPAAYDEILIGTPVWNRKCVPAVSTFLQDEALRRKVTGLIVTSASGDTDKCFRALEGLVPHVTFRASLVDRKHKDYGQNSEKLRKALEPMK